MAELTAEAREGLEIMLAKLRASGRDIPEASVYELAMPNGGTVVIDVANSQITAG